MFHYFNQNTMKKFISALAVVFAIAASYSCQREVDYITDPAQAVTVTYSVSLDQVQKTKATLAELDALAVDKLFYSVYQSNGTAFNAIAHSDYHGSVALTGNTAELQFKLIQGETYKLVFWAQKGDSYITSAVTKDSPLGEISIDYTACDSYAADRDAFTAWDEITLDPVTQGADFATSFSKEIHLKRPFAQVNFGTDDAAQAAAQGYVASKVQVIVKQAATKFNALTGVASEPVDASFKEVALPETPVEFDINNATYTRVAKAYVLPVGTFTVTQDGTSAAISSPLSTTPEVSMILSVKKGENVLALDPRSRANTSIRSNYRTNLLGHLITTDATFNVVVDNDYDGSTDHISIVSLGNATGSNAITMGEDETVSSNINFGDHPVTLDATMTIDGDVTITSNDSNAAATITVNAPIVVTTGSTLTLEGVTIDPASTNATITIQPGATVIVNGGTYTADGDHDLFDLLTNSNPNPAPAKPGMHFAHGADGDQLIIRGGVFTGFDPSDYVDPVHYTVTEAPTGTWTVALKPVTLTLAEGALNLISGGEAVQKAISVDPTDTDLAALEIVNTNSAVASAAFDTNKENVVITPLTAGSTNISIKLGDSVSNIIAVSVTDASTVSVDPTAITVYPGNDSDDITITVNTSQTISSVVSANTDVVTVVWTSGASTFKVHGVAANADPVIVTVTTSANLTATVAVTVSTAPQLATPVPSAASADIADDCFIVKWAPVANATSYAVKYKLASATDFTEVAAANIDATKNPIEATIEGLAPAQTYVVKVQALDGTNYSPSEEASINVTTAKGQSVIAIESGKDAYTVTVGTTATISGVSVKYGDNVIPGAVVTYASDDETIATIENGVITGVSVGETMISVDYEGNSTYLAANQEVITVNVIAAVLQSITLNDSDLAVQKEFTTGDPFNHEGLVVTAHYNNNTTADVTNQATISTPDMSTPGTKTVTVTYQNQQASYDITVTDPVAVTLQNVAITTPATKTAFKYGDAFDATGLVLTGTYSNNSTQPLAPTFEIGGEVVTSGVTPLNTVAESITVTVYSATDATKTATYTISVGKADGSVVLNKSAVTVTAGASDNSVVISSTTNTGSEVTVSVPQAQQAYANAAYTDSKVVITGVAEGSATVTVNVAATTNYTAASATIDVTVEAPAANNGSGTQADPYTVDGAIAYIATLSGDSPNPVYVKGKIQSIKYSFNTEHGTATFDITVDGQANNNAKVQAYSAKYLENTAWVDGLTQIAVGDDVIITGTACLYTNTNNNTTTNEIKDGYIYKLNDVTECEPYVYVAYDNNVAADATSAELTITSNAAWTITGGTGVTPSPASGSGNGSSTLSFAANTSTTDTQSITATVSATGGNEVSVAITQAKAEDPNVSYKWEATALASITADDVFVIVGNNGSNYAMSNDNGTNNAPAAVAVTVSGTKLSGTIADNIQWNLTKDGSNYTFYPNGSTSTWLYCINNNNGAKVGTGNDKVWTITDSYLYNSGQTRYMGIYNSQDWRTYTSINNNIKDQSFTFYVKKVDDGNDPTPTHTITLNSVTGGTISAKIGNADVTQAEEGATVTIAAVADGTHTFSSWSITGATAANASSASTTFVMGTSDVTIGATFTENSGGNNNVFGLYSGELTEGDYIIVYDGGAMNTTVSSDRLQYTDVTVSGNSITTTDATIIWHIAPSGNYWTIYNAGEDKYAASTGAKNKAALNEDGTDDKSLWSCTSTSDSESYDFVNKQNTTNNVNATLRRNGTYGFAAYANTTGGALTLYKKN